ncbi:MAG: serine/threonine-protein phosphatase [Lachnospiraceae bacterium]|nr:serine/threonine-protein phosphatase [Lachnospiraceae bacterium]
MRYLAAAQTDMGNVKKVNQDSLTVKVAQTPQGQIVLAVICDGMGGLSYGEVASSHVVLAFEEWFRTECRQLIAEALSEGDIRIEDIRSSWYRIVHQCNDTIVSYGRQNATNVGTTLTAVLFVKDNYYLIHVGDCRVYELTENMVQITNDQTFVRREVELGHMTPEQAANDPRRNVLLQCVGVNYGIEPDFICGKIRPNASYLLCTDGFRHMITPQEIYETCHADNNRSIESMNLHLKELIDVNKKRKEKDNISAILVRTLCT